MSSTGAVLDRPATAQYARSVDPSTEAISKPWAEGEPPRIPVTYRVSAQTKIWIDLLSAALSTEKTAVVERAVEELFAEKRGDVADYLQRLQKAVAGRNDETLAELLVGRRRTDR